MKITLIISILFLATNLFGQEKSIFNDDENTFLSAFIDPKFEDSGEQYGVTLTKEVIWGYIETSFSTYQKLNPPYYDLIFSGGLALEKNKFTLHTGPRAGFEVRDGGPFLIWGYQGRLLFKLSERFYVGGKLWLDYRYSQDKQFLGNGDMIRENGSLIISYKLN